MKLLTLLQILFSSIILAWVAFMHITTGYNPNTFELLVISFGVVAYFEHRIDKIEEILKYKD